MEKQEITSRLPGALLPWYQAGHRQMPWRETGDPYRIWLSEIMLQQTRVEAVRGYYARFLEALPTVETLAECPDDRLHKLWEGLGYYSRVRNLKKAAQMIVRDHGGRFPENYADILALPGIGPYTAGAISSIAFGHRTPAVDGNVLRVISRLWDDPTPIDLPAQKQRAETALAAVYPREAGAFTQALMELGATLCGPNKQPECESCPCREFCLAHSRGTAMTLPVKSPKKGKRTEEKTVFVLSCDGKYALRKRPSQGLLAKLWEFPNVEGKLETVDALARVEKFGLQPKEILRQVERKHIFTHIIWDMRGIYLEISECGGDFCWFTPEELRNRAALPTAFRQFWEEMDSV